MSSENFTTLEACTSGHWSLFQWVMHVSVTNVCFSGAIIKTGPFMHCELMLISPADLASRKDIEQNDTRR